MMNDTITPLYDTEIDGKVQLYGKNIILWKEYSRPTVESTEQLSEAFGQLIDVSNEPLYIIFDLRNVDVPPNAEIRSMLKITFDQYRNKLIHGCVIVPNTFMKMTAKLVMKSYFNSISYHTKMDDALNTIDDKSHNLNPY